MARLYSCRDSLDFALKNAVEEPGAEDDAVLAKLAERRKQFEEAMDDDLNTADALAAVYELVRDINTHVAAGVHSRRLCEQASELFDTLCGILGPSTTARKRRAWMMRLKRSSSSAMRRARRKNGRRRIASAMN